jgi:serine/threonine protein kinase
LKRKGRLEEKKVVYYLKQIISALQYMHFKNILHRDIKAENLLLSHVSPLILTKMIGRDKAVWFRLVCLVQHSYSQQFLRNSGLRAPRGHKGRGPVDSARRLDLRSARLRTHHRFILSNIYLYFRIRPFWNWQQIKNFGKNTVGKFPFPFPCHCSRTGFHQKTFEVEAPRENDFGRNAHTPLVLNWYYEMSIIY